jgi:hypothetical protein
MVGKKCSRCHARKPVYEFYIKPRGYVENPCNDCRKEINMRRGITRRSTTGTSRARRRAAQLFVGKTCTRCKRWKLLSAFMVRGALEDGRESRCKACDNEINKEYREKCPEKRRAYDARYRLENYDKLKDYKARFRAKPEIKAKENAQSKQWNEDHPERVRANNRHARRTFSSEEFYTIGQVYERTNGRCAYCATSHDLYSYGGTGEAGATWNIDHLQPYSKDGADVLENVCVACITCNSAKRAKLIAPIVEFQEVSPYDPADGMLLQV